MEASSASRERVITIPGSANSEMVEYAVQHMGADRVVCGSDYHDRDYAPQVGRVAGARLSDEDKEKTLWRNAAALLKLDPGS